MKTGISYELALKLKEAGFPQDGVFGTKYMGPNGQLTQSKQDIYPKNIVMFDWAKVPTLSELIEACGEIGFHLRRQPQLSLDWIAVKVYNPLIENSDDIVYGGKTPEEAVAQLYIRLHEKN